jgi:hypothetical protein
MLGDIMNTGINMCGMRKLSSSYAPDETCLPTISLPRMLHQALPLQGRLTL